MAVFRFSLSFRDVEELLAQRGIMVTSETVWQWCLRFGQMHANELRRRRPKTGDKWHMDEVYLKINGKTHSLWKAVDQYGNVLDILVQSRRNVFSQPSDPSLGISSRAGIVCALGNIAPFSRTDSWSGTR